MFKEHYVWWLNDVGKLCRYDFVFRVFNHALMMAFQCGGWVESFADESTFEWRSSKVYHVTV